HFPRASARGSAAASRGSVLWHLARARHRGGCLPVEEAVMTGFKTGALAFSAAAALIVSLNAADTKVDLSKETVGKAPEAFEPMVGTWLIAQDGPDKVVMV